MAGKGMKSLAKDTAIYGLSSIVGRALNALLVPFYMYTFPNPGEYGKVSAIYGYTAFLGILLIYGMETGFFRFMNKESEAPRKVYSSILMSLGTTSILFLALCLLFVNPIASLINIPENPEYIIMMAIVIAIDAFMSIPFAYLRYKKRPIRFASIKLMNIFLSIFFNLFFLLLCPKIYQSNPESINWFYDPSLGIGYIFVSNLLATVLSSLLLIPEIIGFKYTYDKQLMKRIFTYSFPILILGIAGVINQTIAQLVYPFIFENPTEAFEQLGIYSACLKLTVIITMFTQAFRYAYEPFIFAQNKDKNNDEANRQSYATAMTYFIIFALLVFLGVMFYVDLLNYIGQYKKYLVGLNIVPIAMMGEIFFGIYFNLSIWYKLTDKTKYGAWFSIIGCLITIALNFILVPLIGYIGSAWATFVCNLVIMTISYFFGQKYFPIKYDLKKIFSYFLIFAVVYAAAMYPDFDNPILKVAYRTVWLLIFGTIIIKRDLPLSEIPVIGKRFKKKSK